MESGFSTMIEAPILEMNMEPPKKEKITPEAASENLSIGELVQEGIEDMELHEDLKRIPEKMAFKIGDVAEIVGVKQYVLRYWETEFDILRPKKSANKQRMYTRKDVETVFLIKKLLYKDRFSIDGANQAIRKLKSQVRSEQRAFNAADKYQSLILRAQNLVREIQTVRRSLRD